MRIFGDISNFFTNRSVINQVVSYLSTPYTGTAGGMVFGISLSDYPRENLLNLLEILNVEFVIAGSEEYQRAFAFLPTRQSLVSFNLLENNATRLGWFKVEAGEILSEYYSSYYARAVVDLPKP